MLLKPRRFFGAPSRLVWGRVTLIRAPNHRNYTWAWVTRGAQISDAGLKLAGLLIFDNPGWRLKRLENWQELSIFESFFRPLGFPSRRGCQGFCVSIQVDEPKMLQCVDITTPALFLGSQIKTKRLCVWDSSVLKTIFCKSSSRSGVIALC